MRSLEQVRTERLFQRGPSPAPPPFAAQLPAVARSAGESSSAAFVPTPSEPSPSPSTASSLVADVLAYAASQNRAAVVTASAAVEPLPATTVGTPSHSHSLVRDVLAYAASQGTLVAKVTGTAAAAPVMVAAPSSSLVRDVLAYARAEADRVAAAEFAAATSAYAEGMARVRLLERAGRTLDALELSKSLIPPPPPPPMASRTLSPPVALPVGASSGVRGASSAVHARPRARAVVHPSTCALDDWRSLVDASDDPSSVATTSPVHVILEGA
ncbi:hypothetical protein AB1Y20_015039 [Prymnesium parvum]|uniref:Non-specific serine/threonine protein kinase n=1 Tax=Prymnesium parvum TaxID=97485 RepID=A0AB34JXA0_PRYPA